MYVIGVDNGGMGIKAAVFDIRGSEIARSRRNTRMIDPYSAWCEEDHRAVVFRSRQGLVSLGKERHCTRNGIVLTDSRSADIVPSLGTGWHLPCGIPVFDAKRAASQPCALLKWLMENEKKMLENTRRNFGVKDSIRYRMTGVADLK